MAVLYSPPRLAFFSLIDLLTPKAFGLMLFKIEAKPQNYQDHLAKRTLSGAATSFLFYIAALSILSLSDLRKFKAFGFI
jgi:hypothetical protein